MKMLWNKSYIVTVPLDSLQNCGPKFQIQVKYNAAIAEQHMGTSYFVLLSFLSQFQYIKIIRI